MDEENSEEILQNLKEFLTYLEQKKIININSMEKDSEQMNNLI